MWINDKEIYFDGQYHSCGYHYTNKAGDEFVEFQATYTWFVFRHPQQSLVQKLRVPEVVTGRQSGGRRSRESKNQLLAGKKRGRTVVAHSLAV